MQLTQLRSTVLVGRDGRLGLVESLVFLCFRQFHYKLLFIWRDLWTVQSSRAILFQLWVCYLQYLLGTSVSWFWASERTSTGARRKLARPFQSKQSLSHDVITDITSAFLADIRFLFILLVGYAGVFRITKILSLRVKDIIILDYFMKTKLIKRKNDQYRNGRISVLGVSRKPTCPVGIISIFYVFRYQ